MLLLIALFAGHLAAQQMDLLKPPATPPTDVPALESLPVPATGSEVNRREAWSRAKADLRRRWLEKLGPFLGPKAPLKFEIVSTEQLPDYTRQYVKYQVEDGVWTDGYLLKPRNMSGKLPAVVVFHQTTKTQAQQVAGIDRSNPELMNGEQLVKRGYIVLCPRCFIFAAGADYAEHVAIMQRRHPDWTGMARMTWDGIRAVDVLESLPDVDRDRIGGMGHSLGAKEVLYAAAFDERYKVAVFSEGGIGLPYTNWEAIWYLGPQAKAPDFGLEHHQLMALIAPRGFLLLAGGSADGDRSWPFVEAVRPLYRLYHAERGIGWLNHGTGHRYPANAEQAAEAFLDAHLKH